MYVPSLILNVLPVYIIVIIFVITSFQKREQRNQNTAIGLIHMKPKFDIVFSDCLERGIRRGYKRAHKYVENPTEESFLDHIETAIMEELHEYFEFPGAAE
jgi:hypothetical protein